MRKSGRTDDEFENNIFSRSVAKVVSHWILVWIWGFLWCSTRRTGSGAIRGGPSGGCRQLYGRFAAGQRRTQTFGKNSARGSSTDRAGERRKGATNTPQPHSKQTPQRARHVVVILPFRTREIHFWPSLFSCQSLLKFEPPL